MYRTSINGHEIVIRFALSMEKVDEELEKRLIETVLRLEERLLIYKNQCIAIMHSKEGMLVIYIHEGELLDVQIQQYVPLENILE
jgi:hypothetical protein